MIDAADHLYFNVNNVYMTLMMVAPMAVVMLVAMRSMFTSQRRNIAIVTAAVLVFVASFMAMRTQAAVGDQQFLRSMIPHHSGAVLMCERASLTDPEVQALCREIIASQTAEIAQMKALLAPPKMGPNTLDVTVKGADGKPVTDAEVTTLFYMAAMPAMKMPEMKSTATLKHQKDGRYVGNGHVAMAGKWDVTVTVKRGGKEIGSRQFPVTAQ